MPKRPSYRSLLQEQAARDPEPGDLQFEYQRASERIEELERENEQMRARLRGERVQE